MRPGSPAASSLLLSSANNTTLRLLDLAVGERARVLPFSEPMDGYSQTLTRLGLTPGTEFLLLRRAPMGDPVEIRFRGYSLALRPAEASAMCLERI